MNEDRVKIVSRAKKLNNANARGWCIVWIENGDDIATRDTLVDAIECAEIVNRAEVEIEHYDGT